MSITDLNAYPIPYHWALSKFYEYRYQFLFQLAGRFLNTVDVVVDLGCGDGRMAALLATRVRHVYGIDRQHRPLQFARLLVTASNVTLLEGDVLALPFGPEVFTAATCFEVIEHLTPQTAGELLAEAQRVLRAGGRIVLSTPNRLGLRKRVFSGFNPKHYREYSARELTEIIVSQGFDVVWVGGVYLPPPIPRIEHFASVIPFRALFRFLVRAGAYLPALSETLMLIAEKRPSPGRGGGKAA